MYFIPLCVLILYLIYIEVTNRVYRKSIEVVIHVNGIRGKSTVVRMLDAVFREHGYSTFSKVTGTYPKIIDCHGQEKGIKRNIPSINEQRKVMKQAYKQGAKVLIIECMALKKENQRYSHRLLKPNMSLMTNVRTDHLEIMGLNHDDILDHLGQSTGDELVLTSHPFVYDGLRTMGKKVELAKTSFRLMGEHKDNVDLVAETANHFQIGNQALIRGLNNYKKDKCTETTIMWQGKEIYNAFSANDFESTIQLYEAYLSMKASKGLKTPVIMWFNDRHDRPIRSRLFLKWLIKVRPAALVLTGESQSMNRKKLIKAGYDGRFIKENDLSQNDLVFGFGNVKGLAFYKE